jgi:radical SAM superfamily enzyme YgiQ (UPF0313 family)
LKIIEGIKELDIKWFSQGIDIISLKNMPAEHLESIGESGCLKLTVGVESGSKKIRRFMHKGGTPEDILDAAQRLKKFSLIYYCDFMAGIPTETKDDIKATVNLLFNIQKINKNFRNSAFYIYVPYPGTPMYELVKKSDYVFPATLENWADYEWNGVRASGDRRFLEALHFTTLFIDYKVKDYEAPLIFRILVSIYRPVARFRVKNLYFGFLFEKYMYELLQKVWYKVKAKRKL